MNIIDYFKFVRDRYVIRQVERAVLPEFSLCETIRLRVVFEGRVQKVGFRLEVSELAKRLGLTGFCENLENGAVLAELQGPKDRVDFLIGFMHSLKRLKITNAQRTPMEVIAGEVGFVTQ